MYKRFFHHRPPPPHYTCTCISHYVPPDYSSCCWTFPHNTSPSHVHWCLYSSGQHIAAGGHTWPGVSGSRPGDWTSVRESRPCSRLSRSLHFKHDNTLHPGSKIWLVQVHKELRSSCIGIPVQLIGRDLKTREICVYILRLKRHNILHVTMIIK